MLRKCNFKGYHVEVSMLNRDSNLVFVNHECVDLLTSVEKLLKWKPLQCDLSHYDHKPFQKLY